MKATVAVIGSILCFFAVIWGLGFHGAIYNKVIGGAMEDSRHHVFKQSQSYNDGMVTELQNMRLDYLKASPEQQAAMSSIIRHRAATFQGQVPYELRIFIDSLR